MSSSSRPNVHAETLILLRDMLDKTSWYSIDVSVNDRHVLLFYEKFHFCHLLPFAKVGQHSQRGDASNLAAVYARQRRIIVITAFTQCSPPESNSARRGRPARGTELTCFHAQFWKAGLLGISITLALLSYRSNVQIMYMYAPYWKFRSNVICDLKKKIYIMTFYVVLSIITNGEKNSNKDTDYNFQAFWHLHARHCIDIA